MVNKDLEAQAYALLAEGKITSCISWFEDALRKIPATPYHVALGRDLLHQTDSAATYTERFYAFAASKMEVKSIYLEMNGFAINPDLWFMDAFGYKIHGGLDDLDWLADWDTPDFDSFVLTGFEDIQQIYKSVHRRKSQSENIKQASAIAEYLITLRMQELCGAAHRKAADSISELRKVIVLSTSHDFDFISESVLD